jgi:hypothetical protein
MEQTIKPTLSLVLFPILIMPRLSRFRVHTRGGFPVTEEPPSSQPLHHPPTLPQTEAAASPVPELDHVSLPRHFVEMVQILRSSVPSAIPWFGSEDVELSGNHPIAAGGSADIWEVIYCGRKAVLKSYRCYLTAGATQVAEVQCNHQSSKSRC